MTASAVLNRIGFDFAAVVAQHEKRRSLLVLGRQKLANLSMQLARLLRARRNDFRPVASIAVGNKEDTPVKAQQERGPGQLLVAEPLSRPKDAILVMSRASEFPSHRV